MPQLPVLAAADPAAAHDVLRRPAPETEMGRTMRRISLTSWIFIGMAAGVLLGILAPDFAKQLGPVSTVFLRLIKSIIAPLLFGTLVVGIAGSGDLNRMGPIALKALVYFRTVTTFAWLLGVGAVTVMRPGVGVPVRQTAGEAAMPAKQPTVGALLENAFPASIIDAIARNDVLQVVVFTF